MSYVHVIARRKLRFLVRYAQYDSTVCVACNKHLVKDLSRSRHVCRSWHIGVEDEGGRRGRGGTCPPPKKNLENIFSGCYHVKFGHFSGKYHVNFWHLLIFDTYIFGQKCLASHPQSQSRLSSYAYALDVWPANVWVCVSVCFYQRVSIASYANRWYSQRKNVRLSVCLSVCHTPVLYQNEES